MRLVACALLPALKRTCRVNEDSSYIDTMKAAVERLQTDDDPDVVAVRPLDINTCTSLINTYSTSHHITRHRTGTSHSHQ